MRAGARPGEGRASLNLKPEVQTVTSFECSNSSIALLHDSSGQSELQHVQAVHDEWRHACDVVEAHRAHTVSVSAGAQHCTA